MKDSGNGFIRIIKRMIFGSDKGSVRKISMKFRFCSGFVSGALLIFPIFEIVENGFGVMFSNDSDGTLALMLFIFSFFFGFVTVTGKFSTKWFLPFDIK